MPTELPTEEIVRRGQDWYDREIKAKIEAENKGRFVVVDVLTGEYEIADSDVIASNRMKTRNPGAVLYFYCRLYLTSCNLFYRDPLREMDFL
ncbi:MAG: hypothetical protein EXS05_00360 [Planctomycetaceae bacterium]|nr:hypothetical protein [Planctomycetaceae bacterium]